MIHALKEVASHITGSNKIQSSFAVFKDSRYVSIPFSLGKFKPIGDVTGTSRIAFIDGGNMEIITAPDLSVQLIRIYYNIFDSRNKRIAQEKIEFFVVVSIYVDEEKGEIFYKTKIIPLSGNKTKSGWLPKESDLKFSIYEESLSTGGFQVGISKIGETARRFAELSVAEKLCSSGILKEGDIIVHDGTLQSSVTGEADYMDKLYETAQSKGIVIAALAKTSNLLTNGAVSLSSAISELAEQTELNKWFYHPIAKISHPDHQAEIFLVKLHEKSKHVFRFEIFNKQFGSAEKAISLLKNNSSDIAFPGYPYGLLDADKNARVTFVEKNHFKALLQATLGRNKSISSSIHAVDAHDRLNAIV